MWRDRITIKVVGFSLHEYEAGVADVADEFAERPWLLHPRIWWHADEEAMMVQIDRAADDSDADGEGTLDEVWDCILGTLNFAQEIHFSIERTERVEYQ